MAALSNQFSKKVLFYAWILVDVPSIIRSHIDNRKLLLICILLLSHSLIFFRFYLLSIYVCIPVYYCNLCIFIVVYVFLDEATLNEVFSVLLPLFYVNARVN